MMNCKRNICQLLFAMLLASPMTVTGATIDNNKKEDVPVADNGFRAGKGTFLLNGKPFVVKAAELHYPRIPRQYWEHRIKMCKALGMNTICLYVFWNIHEPQMDSFDFNGQNDVAAFCRLAKKNGMYVIVRPGPYVCAEWEMGGLPWWQALCVVLISVACMALGVQSSSIAGTLCSAFGLGVVLYEFGERLPIWNNYIGGGLLMAFFGTALLKFFNIIPEKTLDNINRVISGDDVNLLEVYIIFLIAGSVLALDKDILLKSFVGYIPSILGGLAMAALLGVLVGLAVGVDPQTTIMKYVLPIMGGGNGAGAVPLSNIYETVTGDPAANFYGFAIIILTIGNIFAIIGSALLNTLGEKFPALTGDKKTIVRGGEHLAREDKKVTCTMQDELGALVLTLGCYGVGRLMSKVILPKIAGASIHAYAYMIIFVVILAATGIVPEGVRAGAKRTEPESRAYAEPEWEFV